MTEDEARAAILANGYEILREQGRHVTVLEERGLTRRTWTGVNFKDLASSFKLHERKAGE